MNDKALIDNDFLQHIVQTDISNLNVSNIEELISYFFNDLKVKVKIHELVYENETKSYLNDSFQAIISKLLEKDIISLSLVEIYRKDENLYTYYKTIVEHVYKEFTGKKYPCERMLDKWAKQGSLGEVHSVVHCFILGYNCFLSDDKKAISLSKYFENEIDTKIAILSRDRCKDIIKENPNKKLNRLQINALVSKR